MDLNEAKKIMELNKRFYDLLADDFSRTNINLWEEFKSLSEYFREGDQVLDLGCGNGRFYDLICQQGKTAKYFGVDNSARLIDLAKQKYPQGQFILNNGLELPFGENFFDKVLCIAVLHHLPGYELRREFLRQARRVLKKGGLLILTTIWLDWSKSRSWRQLIKYSWLKIVGKSKLDWGDFYEPWGGKGVRYFHSFTRKEISDLFKEVGWQVENIGILNRRSGERNIVVIARKQL